MLPNRDPQGYILRDPIRTEVSIPALGAVGHCQQAPWPEQLAGKAKVRGEVYRRDRKGKKLWDLSDRSVPKNVSLKFFLTTNIRAPYQVYWQVVNTGAEAQAARDLRGDFYESEGSGTRWEHTKYAGTHWIEAFVIKNGRCVARSGRFLVKVRA